MSITIALIPLAIALSATTVGAADKIIKEEVDGKIQPIETIFNDFSLLEQTLREHGLKPAEVSENKIVCNIGEVILTYTRETNDLPFMVEVNGILDIQAFRDEMSCFEKEYRENVQSYTYDKLINSLTQNNMEIVKEELLEDNSILLTIDI